jgi:predicted pyridoxine 5'-phosphate oxidase superfamily flavin-nucleotide-binding protein
VNDFYHDGSRELQDRFDTRRLADRIEARLMRDRIGPEDKAFIEAQDMFFLATADDAGQPSCSYKGGDPGFVRVVDQGTIVFPSYDGNGMFLSCGNLARNARVGLLFIDFVHPKRLRISGEAKVSFDDPLLPCYPEAQFIVRVAVAHVFPNCPRYIHKYTRAETSEFVPKAGCATPVPSWKKNDWAKDVLPENDPARET